MADEVTKYTEGSEGTKVDEDGMIVNADGTEPVKGSRDARINTLTKNWRTTERTLEQVNSQLSEKDSALKETGEYVKQLVSKVEDLTTKQTKEVMDSEVNSLESEVSSIEDEIAEASKDEDWGKAMSLNNKLRRAERKLIIAQNKPVDVEALKAELKKEVAPVSNNGDNDLKAQLALRDFQRDNDWYTNDDRMKRYADNLSFELVQSGKYKDYDTLLVDVKKQTEKAFDVKPAQGHNSVAGGSYGSAGNSNSNDVELTDADKRMASNMGISEKDFLKSKRISAGGKV